MSNYEFMVCVFYLICCLVSIVLGVFFDFWYFSRRLKALSKRIDKLVLKVEQLEMERDKLEK